MAQIHALLSLLRILLYLVTIQVKKIHPKNKNFSSYRNIFSDFISYGNYFFYFSSYRNIFSDFLSYGNYFFHFSSYGNYFFRFLSYGRYFFHFFMKIRSTDNMKWVNRRKLVLLWKTIFMEEWASITHVTSDKKKAGLLLWFVNLFWSIFSFSSQTFCFFLEAFGLFGIFWPSKGLTAFLRPKNPKEASGLKKKQNVFKLQLKILRKKLTHHEKMPAFFLSLVPYHIDAHSSMILDNFSDFTLLEKIFITTRNWIENFS